MNLLDLMVRIGVDDQASEKLKGLGDKAKSAFGKLKAATIAGAAAAGAATIKLVSDSVNAGMNFDKAMSQVAATMGKSMEDMENEVGTVDLAWGTFNGNLRDYAQEMGANTAFSATQAAEALNYMALAGYDTQTSMEMLPNVLNLAAAGNIDLAAASDMVTDAQSALGLDLAQTKDMVDQMAAASSKTNTSVQQLGDAFLTVGGTAKGLKGGTVELAQALGLLADNGIKGSEGGTALRNVLLGFSSEKFEESFGALGVSAYDAEGNMRSLKDVFADMNTVMADMSVEEKTKLLAEAFNKVDLKSLNALLATDAERWDEVEAAISDSAGAAEKMANTQLDNLQGDVTLFQSALEGLQIALSDKIAPALRVFVGSAGSILQELTTAIKDGTISSVSDMIRYIRENIPEMMDAAGEFIGQILDAIAEQGPEIISELISLVANLVGYVVKHIPDMLAAAAKLFFQFTAGLIKEAPNVLQNIGNMLLDMLSAIASFFGPMASYGIQLIGSIIGGMVQVLGNIPITVAKGIREAVSAVGSFVGEMWSAGWNVVQGIIDGIWSNIGNVASTILSGFRGAVDTVKSFLGIASPSKLFAEIGKNTMLGMAEGIEDNMAKAQNAMRDAADAVYGAGQGEVSIGASYGVAGSAYGVPGMFGVTFNGPVTIEANDPEELFDKLAAMASISRHQYA